ncbi:hypothetical protein GC194_15045 [bacterium]|nr:hypothetical protein [bacterium]
MSVNILRNFRAKAWSGGTTTELFIYPESADFATRSFAFRLSIATINDEYSVFTALPNTQRILMLLEGKIKLAHKKHHQKNLLPYEYDQFDGAWKTESFGTGKDFNVMTKGQTKASIEHHKLIANSHLDIAIKAGTMLFVYPHKGTTTINGETINQGELAHVAGEHEANLAAKTDSELVLVQVFVP